MNMTMTYTTFDMGIAAVFGLHRLGDRFGRRAGLHPVSAEAPDGRTRVRWPPWRRSPSVGGDLAEALHRDARLLPSRTASFATTLVEPVASAALSISAVSSG